MRADSLYSWLSRNRNLRLSTMYRLRMSQRQSGLTRLWQPKVATSEKFDVLKMPQFSWRRPCRNMYQRIVSKFKGQETCISHLRTFEGLDFHLWNIIQHCDSLCALTVAKRLHSVMDLTQIVDSLPWWREDSCSFVCPHCNLWVTPCLHYSFACSTLCLFPAAHDRREIREETGHSMIVDVCDMNVRCSGYILIVPKYQEVVLPSRRHESNAAVRCRHLRARIDRSYNL